MAVRRALRKIFEALLRRSARTWTAADLSRPALVVAPHPDDETLGCGGTIVKKRLAGAPVTIVFMTDGSKSHCRLMDEDELRAIRRKEALAAASVLGVDDCDVVFLNFSDGNLRESRNAAVERLVELIENTRVEQIFTPYRDDVTDDHVVTTAVVEHAVGKCGRNMTVYEYPIWLWRRWPWSTCRGGGLRGLLGNAKDLALWTWTLLFRFRSGMVVSDALETKRRALAEHRSQTTRLKPDPAWKTLSDVADGEFLECFFQDVEPFIAISYTRADQWV